MAWIADLKSLRKIPSCPRKEIETLVGRLNHTSTVQPDACHFLSRICASMDPESSWKHTV